jgi:hypothetical protein
MTDDRNDQFDDLFEPFELTEPPVGEQETPTTRRSQGTTGVAPPRTTSSNLMCPSCGALNPSYNRHCEQCGARLSQDPLPVAPAPMSRTSPGGRALGVLAAVVLIVALVALIFNVFRGGDNTAESTSTSSSSTTTIPPVVTEVFPSQAEASSELVGFEASNLIDGDPATAWNDDSARGKDAVLTFRFARPVALKEIEFQNLSDDERFKLNYKIQGFSITVDDLSIEINDRLDNTNEPQRISVASVETTEVVITVLSTYTAEPAADRPPFDELALQEIRFFGTER